MKLNSKTLIAALFGVLPLLPPSEVISSDQKCRVEAEQQGHHYNTDPKLDVTGATNIDSNDKYRKIDNYKFIPNARLHQTLTLNPGENCLYSAVIDTNNGYAYFGTNTSGEYPNIIVKIRLSDFTRVGSIQLNLGETALTAAVIDTTRGFAYFGASRSGPPADIVKLDLSTFTIVDRLSLGFGESMFNEALIDSNRGFAYFALDNGYLKKIDISTFTVADTIKLSHGSPRAAVIDTTNNIAYFGCQVPGELSGVINKVDLQTFQEIGSITLPTNEKYLESGVIDTSTGYAYFSENTIPGKIAKIDNSAFNYVGSVVLNSGEDATYTALIDPLNNRAYFGENTTRPGKVIKIDLNTFTEAGSITWSPGEYNPMSAVIDTTNGFMYFGTCTMPGKIIRNVLF